MPFIQTRQLADQVWTAGEFKQVDHSGLIFDKFHIDYDVTLTTSGAAATVAEEGAAGYATEFELMQDNEPAVRVPLADLRVLDALASASTTDMVTATANNGVAELGLDIDFQYWTPGAHFDATERQVHSRMRLEANTTIADTATNSTGTIRQSVAEVGSLPGAAYRPRWSQTVLDIGQESRDIQHSITFDRTTVVTGMLVRVRDASASQGTDPFAKRSDGLVRNLEFELVGNDRVQKRSRFTWDQLKKLTARRFGLSKAEAEASDFNGVAYIPLDEPGSDFGAVRFNRGAVLNLHFDTQSTPPAQYTAVTPANGDQVFVTLIGALPVQTPEAATRNAARQTSGGRTRRRSSGPLRRQARVS